MENWLQQWIHLVLAALALPEVGLPAIFLISLVSATLLPMGSEPAVFAYVQMAPDMFWPAVLVATVGNTLGGSISFAMGAGAETAWHNWKGRPPGGRWQDLLARWFNRSGPPILLLSWLPGIGDPLCAVAGWMRLPFWPSVAYMAAGKFLRYVIMTALLIEAWPWVVGWF